MKKKYRLSDRKVFESIIKSHKIYSKKYLIYFSRNNCDFFRISINASKSKFKLAVDRNKIKRQVRTFFDKLHNKNISLDLLIIVNKSYLEDTYKNNCLDFLNLVKRLENYKSKDTSLNLRNKK